MVDISKTKKALLNIEFHNFLLTSRLFTTITDEAALDKLLKVCIEQDENIYLPLRKIYSLEVKLEDELSDPTPKQLEAGQKLKEIALKISNHTRLPLKEVEDKFRNIAIVGFRNIDDLPLEFVPYANTLATAYSAFTEQDKKNIKIVTEILKQRVVNSKLKPLLSDWTEELTKGLGTNFINSLLIDFILPERNGWVVEEIEEDSEGEYGQELKESKREKNQSISTTFTETSNPGELETVDTVI